MVLKLSSKVVSTLTIIAFMLALALPVPASANSDDIHVAGGISYGQFPYTVTESGVGQWSLDFFIEFPTVHQVCVHLTFNGNLLDPGEKVRVQMAGGTTGIVVTNSGSSATSFASACFTDPSDIDWYKTSNIHAFRVYGVSGSVNISRAGGNLYFE